MAIINAAGYTVIINNIVIPPSEFDVETDHIESYRRHKGGVDKFYTEYFKHNLDLSQDNGENILVLDSHTFDRYIEIKKRYEDRIREFNDFQIARLFPSDILRIILHYHIISCHIMPLFWYGPVLNGVEFILPPSDSDSDSMIL